MTIGNKKILTPGKVKARLIKGTPPSHKLFVPVSDTDKPSNKKEIILTIAEWEALRLCDYENYKQRDAAKTMALSQPTINRLLSKAHFKVIDAFMHGYALKFEDDSLVICPFCQTHLSSKNAKSITCPGCNKLIELDT